MFLLSKMLAYENYLVQVFTLKLADFYNIIKLARFEICCHFSQTRGQDYKEKHNLNSKQRAREYKVTAFLRTDCEF